MKRPATDWREVVAADEAQRYARYAEQFAELQRRKSARHGPGRALHRKQILGLQARLEVLPKLPAHARHGLFARPGTYEAWVRLSSGGPDRASDRRPDVRGFAVKVRGLDAPGALGGRTTEQDFLLINHPAFAFRGSDEFVGLALSAMRGPAAVLGHLVTRYGPIGGLKQLRRIGKTFGKPFRGFAAETMHSAAPIACGPYAAKVRLVPGEGSDAAPAAGREDWAGDVTRRLAGGDLRFDLQLQFFVDEATTPIEDASVEWPAREAPFVTVARLTIPAQDPSGAPGEQLARAVEAGRFDPWNALAEHRPLGDVMRARKVVYYESQKGRQA